MSASMTLRPVWSGTVTGARSMMGAAGRSMGSRSLDDHRALAVERPTERVDDASHQAVAHGHVHDPARALDFVARVQMPVVAEQHDADFVLVHVERDAEHAARKLHQLLEAHAGKAGDLGDAGGDAGDRADLRGSELRREGFTHLADAREGVSKTALQAFRRSAHGLCVLGLGSSGLRSGLAPASARRFGSGLACCVVLLLQELAHALLQRREVVRDAPAHLLPVRGELDPAHQIRRGLEPDADVRREGLVERVLDRRALLRGQLERAAHERGLGRRLEGLGRGSPSPGRPSLAGGG